MSSYNEAMKLYAQAPVGGLKKKGKKGDKPLRRTYHMIKAEQNANQLEVLFEVQRRENEAAKTIQIAWRRTRILLPWRNAVRMMMAIVTIQRRARGMIARNLVAKWFYMRNSFATEIQARTRRQLSNLKVRPILAMERAMVIRIQRIARGKLARKRAVAVLRDLAATRIQALWRGCVDRSRADREWLHKAIISVQNAARRKLALNRYQAEKDRLTRAAVVIQRKFRSYQAAIAIGDKLVARELKYRHECIKMLVAEAELCNEKIARIMDRAVKSQVREKAVAAQQALQAQERVVYGMENDLSELIHQRQTLSPRAIEQGFDEELDKNIAEYRIKLTQSKLHCLFDLQREMHHADRNLEHQVAELEEWASNRNRMEKWCAQEYDDRRHVTYQRDITARRKAKQRAIAEERRLWQVLYYTRDGKPDKKRRPGKPWDPSVYAGAERATYCGANVDLLAFVRQQAPAAAAAAAQQQQLLGKLKSKQTTTKKKKKKSTGIGIGEEGDKDLAQSVQTTVEQVSLQTFLDEVKVYQELLDPIQSILEKNTGLAPDSRPPEELGWGPEGAQLAEALATVRGEPRKAKRFGVGRTTTTVAASSQPPSRGSGSRPSSPSARSVASSSSSTFRQRGGFQAIGFNDDATVASGSSRVAASLGSVDARAAGFEPSLRGVQSPPPSLSRQPSQRLSRQPSGLGDNPVATDASRRPRDTRPMSPPPPALGRRVASGAGLGKQVSFQDMFAHGSSDESAAGHHHGGAAKLNANANAADASDGDEDGDENLLGTAAALLLQLTRTKKLSRPSRFHKKPPKSFLPAEDAFDDRVVFGGRRPRREATSTASVAFGDNGDGGDAADDVSSRRGGGSGSVEELDELPLRAFRRRADAAAVSSSSSASSALSVASSKASSKALSMRDHDAKLLSRSLPASREVLAPSSAAAALSLSASSATLPPVVLRSHSNVSVSGVAAAAAGDGGPLLAPRNLHSDDDFGSATSLAAMMANVLPPSMETQEADHQRAVQLHAQRRSKKANQRRLGIIPWELLDEVDGMRHRFENEKRYVEFNKKF